MKRGDIVFVRRRTALDRVSERPGIVVSVGKKGMLTVSLLDGICCADYTCGRAANSTDLGWFRPSD